MSRALRDIPAVRALAEREAREHYEAYAKTVRAMPMGQALRAWGAYDFDTFAEVSTHLTLLTDLSRPASRDALARLVAEAVGLDVSHGALFVMATTPGRCYIACGTSPDCWHIFDAHCEERSSVFHGGTMLPTLSGVTDRAEALAIIADAVLP